MFLKRDSKLRSVECLADEIGLKLTIKELVSDVSLWRCVYVIISLSLRFFFKCQSTSVTDVVKAKLLLSVGSR